jgi:hypothetical protein
MWLSKHVSMICEAYVASLFDGRAASGRLYRKGHANFSATHMRLIFKDFSHNAAKSRPMRSETSELARESG